MQLCVENLRDGFGKAVYKNVTMDMLIYKRLKMFIHAESQTGESASQTGARLALEANNSSHIAGVADLEPSGGQDIDARGRA